MCSNACIFRPRDQKQTYLYSPILQSLLLLDSLPHRLGIRSVLLKLPCGHPLDEHLVELLVRPPCSLRLVQPKIHQTNTRQPPEDEAQLAAQIELVRVEQVRQDKRPHGVEHVLQREAQPDGLDAQPRGRHLAQDGVGGGADGHVVPPAVQQDHADGGLGAGWRAGDSAGGHDEQDQGEYGQAVEREVAAADAVDEVPRHYISEQGDDLLDNLQLEGHGGGEPSKLHVIRGVARGEGDAGERLDGQRGNGDHGAAEVGLAEALEIRDALGFALDFLERVDDQGKLLLAFNAAVAEAVERLEGKFGTVLADEPPRAFRHEKHEDGGYGCEAVLGAEDGAVRPSVGVGAGGVDDEGDGEGTKGICQGSQACQHTAKSKWSNLANVCDRDRSEGTDGEPIEELAPEKQLVRGSHEFHGDGRKAYNQAQHDHLTAADPIRKLTASQSTNNSAIRR
jgi:hypothetical protein